MPDTQSGAIAFLWSSKVAGEFAAFAEAQRSNKGCRSIFLIHGVTNESTLEEYQRASKLLREARLAVA